MNHKSEGHELNQTTGWRIYTFVSAEGAGFDAWQIFAAVGFWVLNVC